MDFESILKKVGDEPLFESSFLFAGAVKPEQIQLQLTRWTQTGRLYQLRRGLYAPAPPYQKVVPHPYVIANQLQHASYVSMQSALAYFGLIPEMIQSTTSVTAGRPGRYETPLGTFEYRHVQSIFLQGYHLVDVGKNQRALVATPEKALLDLIYLQPGGDSLDYLRELRLQNLDRLDMNELRRMAEILQRPKLLRAILLIETIRQEETQGYEKI